jgi:antirestriction protein ArdC|tara:strand:+ start:2571 stop:3452 length:882 start_codon:yes stop_codon:yes gene_type:complete
MSAKVVEIVTNKIIEKLEEGVVPWNKPWMTVEARPKNMITKRPYRGINALIASPMVSGYEDPHWMTGNQIRKMGMKLMPEQKYTPILFFNWIEKTEEGKTKKIPFMKFYKHYNRRQIEGHEVTWPVSDESIGVVKPVEGWEIKAKEMLDTYLSAGGPTLEEGKSGCWYMPSTDVVGMPFKDKFHSNAEYWSSMFHEMTHSTGATKRLDRELKGFNHNRHAYSEEELVAEMGACFMLADLGVERHINNSAAYIDGWLKKLKGDRSFLVKASQRAQKAYDYMKGEGYVSANKEAA